MGSSTSDRVLNSICVTSRTTNRLRNARFAIPPRIFLPITKLPSFKSRRCSTRTSSYRGTMMTRLGVKRFDVKSPRTISRMKISPPISRLTPTTRTNPSNPRMKKMKQTPRQRKKRTWLNFSAGVVTPTLMPMPVRRRMTFLYLTTTTTTARTPPRRPRRRLKRNAINSATARKATQVTWK